MTIDWKERGRELAILLSISAFLAFINPYGASPASDYLSKLAYWSGLVVFGGVVGTITTKTVMRLAPNAEWWVFLVLSSLIVAVFVTGALYAVHGLFAEPLPLRYLGHSYTLVLVITVALTSIAILLGRAGVTQTDMPMGSSLTADVLAEAETARQKFMNRLPARYRDARIFGINSEDHYLRVHTDKGEELILMRLSDAVTELEPLNGQQVHRSWWVARDGIDQVQRSAGKVSLGLKSGAIAPVSRANAKRLKEEGWL